MSRFMHIDDDEAVLELPAAQTNDFPFRFRFGDELCWSTPAFVLGWVVPSMRPAVAEPPLPNVLSAIFHQYGGLACKHALMVGLILPVAANTDKIAGHVEMQRVLTLFGDDGEHRFAVRRELRDLRVGLERSWLTCGDEFDEELTASWNVLIARWAPGTPEIRRGFEALIEFESFRMSAFEGWRTLAIRSHPTAVQEVQTTTLSAGFGEQLAMLGSQLKLGAPRLWLLWENSD